MAQATNDNTTSPTHLRGRMVEAIERLLVALDALDAVTEDLEDDAGAEPVGDDEPTFGWSDQETRTGRYTMRGDSQTSDLESDNDCDREDDDPAGGDINDEPHDEESDEPSLGALADGDEPRSQISWASGDLSDREDDPGNVGSEGWPTSAETRAKIREGRGWAQDALSDRGVGRPAPL